MEFDRKLFSNGSLIERAVGFMRAVWVGGVGTGVWEPASRSPHVRGTRQHSQPEGVNRSAPLSATKSIADNQAASDKIEFIGKLFVAAN